MGLKITKAASVLWLPLICPRCAEQHVDRGDWAKRLHTQHLCEHCGLIFRPDSIPEDGSVYSFGIET